MTFMGHDSMTHDINIDPVGVNYGHLSWHITRHVQAVAAVKRLVVAWQLTGGGQPVEDDSCS